MGCFWGAHAKVCTENGAMSSERNCHDAGPRERALQLLCALPSGCGQLGTVAIAYAHCERCRRAKLSVALDTLAWTLTAARGEGTPSQAARSRVPAALAPTQQGRASGGISSEKGLS